MQLSSIPVGRSSAHLVLLALLAGCHDRGGGEVIVVDGGPPPALLEIEPNDNALQADFIGEILPGDALTIEGHITECCPDPYDGFAFFAPGPVELVLSLSATAPGADLDFAIYDPEVDAVVASFETDQHPEFGVFPFAGSGELHVVVNSFFGDSGYFLDVDVRPLVLGLTAQTSVAPENAPDRETERRYAAYSAGTSTEPGVPEELRLLRVDADEGLLLEEATAR